MRTSRLIRGIRRRNQKFIIVLKSALSFYILLFGINYLVNGTEAYFRASGEMGITITAMSKFPGSENIQENEENDEVSEEVMNTENNEAPAIDATEDEKETGSHESNQAESEPNQQDEGSEENQDIEDTVEASDEAGEETSTIETIENQETEIVDELE